MATNKKVHIVEAMFQTITFNYNPNHISLNLFKILIEYPNKFDGIILNLVDFQWTKFPQNNSKFAANNLPNWIGRQIFPMPVSAQNKNKK